MEAQNKHTENQITVIFGRRSETFKIYTKHSETVYFHLCPYFCAAVIYFIFTNIKTPAVQYYFLA